MKVAMYVTDDTRSVIISVGDMEPTCGDTCTWCGCCIACTERQIPAHATPAQEAHRHFINYTEAELQQRGLELP